MKKGGPGCCAHGDLHAMEQAKLAAKLQSCLAYLRSTAVFPTGTLSTINGWRGGEGWNGNRRQVSDPDHHHVLPMARQKLQL
jgi:hypothetical protein